MFKLFFSFILLASLALCQNPVERVITCTDAEASDTYVCTPTPAVGAYAAGQRVRMKANTANTDGATINVSTLGAKAIVKVSSGITTALSTNDIRAGQYVDLVYDGTNFQMLSQLGNSGSGASTQERSVHIRLAGRTANSTNTAFAVYDAGVTIAIAAASHPEVTLTFPDATEYWATASFMMPNDWNGGTVKVIAHAISTVSQVQTHVMRASVSCVNASGALAADRTNAVSGTVATPVGAGNIAYWALSSITATNCSAGEIGHVSIGRLGNDAADTSTYGASVLSLEVRYVSNQ